MSLPPAAAQPMELTIRLFSVEPQADLLKPIHLIWSMQSKTDSSAQRALSSCVFSKLDFWIVIGGSGCRYASYNGEDISVEYALENNPSSYIRMHLLEHNSKALLVLLSFCSLMIDVLV